MIGVSPVAIGVLWIGAGLQEQLDERRASVGAGQGQRGDAEVVRRVRVGAGADQQVGGRRHRSSARPRGAPSSHHPIGHSRRRADSAAYEPVLVLVPGRLDQPEIAVCGGGRRPSAASSEAPPPHRPVLRRRACCALSGGSRVSKQPGRCASRGHAKVRQFGYSMGRPGPHWLSRGDMGRARAASKSESTV